MAHNREYLSFEHIDYPHLFLCHYRPLSTGKDPLSRSLLRFKHSRQPDLAAWADCSSELLSAAGIPHNTLILRALHHDETQASLTSALDILGQTLASSLHSSYQPLLLLKTTPCRPIKDLPHTSRNTILQNLYNFSDQAKPPAILIIDDIFTTGTTMRAILQAIHTHFLPNTLPPVTLFTLAKTSWQPSPPDLIHNQNYSLGADSTWTANDLAATYIVSPHHDDRENTDARNLKSLIRTDSFYY